MVMIANLQYGWTFFVPDIQKQFGWDRASIQIAFTLFVLFETWLVPVEVWFVDHYGPQIVVFFGGIACGLGWALNAYATTLGAFYTAQIIAGIRAGAVYGTCIGNSLKWFQKRRGLAAGLTAAGFGGVCINRHTHSGNDQKRRLSKYLSLFRRGPGNYYARWPSPWWLRSAN